MKRIKRGSKGLSWRQGEYLKFRSGGMKPQEAALQAGFSPSYAKTANRRISQLPAVATEMAQIQEKGREQAAYTMAVAMQEAQDAADFAVKHKNPMAYVKAIELRAKLSGLLIERVQVEKVDLTAALAEANARVVDAAVVELIESKRKDDLEDSEEKVSA